MVLFVLCSAYWHQAWAGNWRSDTVWRARLWIPYAAMPIGLGLLVLQYVIELIGLATGKTAARSASTSTGDGLSATTQGGIVLVTTLLFLLSGIPVAFGLGAISIVFLVIFQGLDALHVVAETF